MVRKVVHLELYADDRPATAKFYAELFGWGLRDFPDMGYTTLATGSEETGVGIGTRSAESPAGPVLYIESVDLQADLQAIVAQGGKAVDEPMEIPGVGTIAFFKDPAGNLMALGKFISA
jgi:predicted enzyme related to lactoylglutathione lyase